MRAAAVMLRVSTIALLLAGLGACAVEGGGYDGDVGVGVGVGYGGDYYEPGGYDYGHWGPGYRVGPPRGHESGGRGRPAPSIPSHARSGGGGGAHGGGEHGGGGHR